MATNIDPKTLFSTPNHCVTSFSLWNIRFMNKSGFSEHARYHTVTLLFCCQDLSISKTR